MIDANNAHTEPRLNGRKICLVTSSNIGSNPRLVKEANALVESGAIVHVVAIESYDSQHLAMRDEHVRQTACWTYTAVQSKGWRGSFHRKFWKLTGRLLYCAGIRGPAVENMCFNPLIRRLADKAINWPADMYIAHNLAALPAAWLACGQHRARLGFDAEDFHSGQFGEGEKGSLLEVLTIAIEQWYLPLCDHLTAASAGIADAYARCCPVSRPQVVLNVFPLVEGAEFESPTTGSAQPSVYWFSQTIGPGRGLETIIAAASIAGTAPFVYLQGTPVPGYLDKLLQGVNSKFRETRIRILPPVMPDEIPGVCLQFDVGMASEVSAFNINRDIALSNKIFTYMLAGMAIVASDTKAQQALADECDSAICIYPQENVHVLAAILDEIFRTPGKLATLRKNSWALGRTRYNWNLEKKVFLDAVVRCLHSAGSNSAIS